MIFDEYLLNAKVVVEDTNGMPNFMARALPQTAIESATIQSGFSCFKSAHTLSSRANVVSTKIFVANAKSLPRRTESCAVNFCSISNSSHETNIAPVDSIFSRRAL